MLLYQLAADRAVGVVKRAGVIAGRRLAAATANIVKLYLISRPHPAHVVMTCHVMSDVMKLSCRYRKTVTTTHIRKRIAYYTTRLYVDVRTVYCCYRYAEAFLFCLP